MDLKYCNLDIKKINTFEIPTYIAFALVIMFISILDILTTLAIMHGKLIIRKLR